MLIIGCGYIGKMLGKHLVQQGKTVTGTVSSSQGTKALTQLGISPIVTNLDHPPAEIPLAGHKQIFYFAPPPTEGTTDPRLKLILDQIRQTHQTPRIVYTSTTGVYGDCQGEWVKEDRPLNPTTERAQRRVDAETQLLKWSEETGGEAIILRVAGIYGPGRLPIDRLRLKAPMISQTEAPFTNRIHAEDLVTACLAAMDHARNCQIYNVSDGTPGTMAQYFNLLADVLSMERPPVITWAQAEQVMPPGLLSYLKENRRIDNSRLKDELGVRLKYPQLEKGLKASLASDPSQGENS